VPRVSAQKYFLPAASPVKCTILPRKNPKNALAVIKFFPKIGKTRMKSVKSSDLLEKVATGIAGFDEITNGGLPAGRPTLVCGGAGCGKSLFGTEFLVRGITQYQEAGVLMTFEETAADIKKNVSSLGFNISDLIARKKLFIDHVRVERSEIEENGEYDLEGLFIRLDHAIKTVNAKRVVLDTVESLFAGLNDQAVLRSELRRLFACLKDVAMPTTFTGKRGEGK